jgi:hypothetical protein
MTFERYQDLVRQVCAATDVYDVERVLERRSMEVEGFTVLLEHVVEDQQAMYLQFDYGVTTAGRTLRVFRMMLESNLLVYAQDQAQLALNPDTGGAMLILRVPMTDEIDGAWLAETLVHYAEHGRYWHENISTATDEMFEGIAAGDYSWLRA